MNVYSVLVILVVIFILLYEFVPSAQKEIRQACIGTKCRLKELRAFIDDDDYDVMGQFRNNPFTMSEYLSRQECESWDKIQDRARRRQCQGWGSPHFDGPDFLSPHDFWWRDGTLVRRRPHHEWPPGMNSRHASRTHDPDTIENSHT